MNVTRENEIGWGRKGRLPEGKGVYVSQNIASSLHLQNGDVVYVEIIVEYLCLMVLMNDSSSLFLPSHCTKEWYFLFSIVICSSFEEIQNWRNQYDCERDFYLVTLH